MFEALFDHIDDRLEEVLEKGLRPGFYVATVTNALQSLRRQQISPEWLDGALDQARRISSPLLDVIPATNTRMAILSQDGVPEFPAVIGKIWDDAGPVDQMTAWLRANLQEHPGHLELGADKGLRIQVGHDRTTINETADGEIVIESDQGDVAIRVKPDGTIRMADGDEQLARASDVESELQSIRSDLDGHSHTFTGVPAGNTGTTNPSSSSGSVGDVESPSIYGD